MSTHAPVIDDIDSIHGPGMEEKLSEEVPGELITTTEIEDQFHEMGVNQEAWQEPAAPATAAEPITSIPAQIDLDEEGGDEEYVQISPNIAVKACDLSQIVIGEQTADEVPLDAEGVTEAMEACQVTSEPEAAEKMVSVPTEAPVNDSGMVADEAPKLKSPVAKKAPVRTRKRFTVRKKLKRRKALRRTVSKKRNRTVSKRKSKTTPKKNISSKKSISRRARSTPKKKVMGSKKRRASTKSKKKRVAKKGGKGRRRTASRRTSRRAVAKRRRVAA